MRLLGAARFYLGYNWALHTKSHIKLAISSILRIGMTETYWRTDGHAHLYRCVAASKNASQNGRRWTIWQILPTQKRPISFHFKKMDQLVIRYVALFLLRKVQWEKCSWDCAVKTAQSCKNCTNYKEPVWTAFENFYKALEPEPEPEAIECALPKTA